MSELLYKVVLLNQCRTKCGYCHGERAHVLTQGNPPLPVGPNNVQGEPQVVTLPVEEVNLNVKTGSSGTNAKNNYQASQAQEVITYKTSSDAYACNFCNISAEAYLILINKGWRRSGELLYRPKNWQSCCACIPIRLDTAKFKISKSQKRVLKRFQQALLGQPNTTSSSPSSSAADAPNDKSNRDTSTNSSAAEYDHQYDKSTTKVKSKRQKFQNQSGFEKCNWNDNKVVQSCAKQCLQQTGIAESLRESVRLHVDGVLSNLLEHGKDEGGHNYTSILPALDALREKDLLGKLCKFKVTKISKPKRESSNDHNVATAANSDESARVIVSLSNMICPALHGKTKGRINKMDLGRAITERIRDDCSGINYQIKSVGLHDKSGHINVDIEISISSYQLCKVKMSDSGGGQNNNRSKQNKNVFSEFIRGIASASGTEIDASDLEPPYRLTVRTIPSHISARMPQVHRLYCKYQTAVHGDKDPFKIPDSRSGPKDQTKSLTSTKASSSMQQNKPHSKPTSQANSESSTKGLSDDEDIGDFDSNHDLDVDDDYHSHSDNVDDHNDNYDAQDSDDQPITESDIARLYPRHDASEQREIYKSYNDFYRFLCKSPLPHIPHHASNTAASICTNKTSSSSIFEFDEDDVQTSYGSHHQHYLINDKYLIAVGVVDILPQCLSSVYSFYDPFLSQSLNLGKLTALYEIEWLKNASRYRPDLKYQYLGYYIHSCQKMKYKAEYKPSELLCTSKNLWVDFEVAKERLEARSPVRHCCNISTSDEEFRKKFIHYSSKEANGDENGDLNSVGNGHEEKKDGKRTSSAVESYSPASAVSRIKFYIHSGNILTLNSLNEEGQAIVQPMFEEFVREIGEEILDECLIKLC